MVKRWASFLLDVLFVSLSSFGGPEAHYGVFSQMLVSKKKYLSETTLSELIGVFALVPGPSSTQTITAIGYLVGGKLLAFLTFIVWALPAILVMTMVGLFFSLFQHQPWLSQFIDILPPIAIGFIVYAGWSISRKVIKNTFDILLFLGMIGLAMIMLPWSIWTIPLLLILAGLVKLIWHPQPLYRNKVSVPIPWFVLVLVLTLAIGGEILAMVLNEPIVTALVSFYRFGYSVIGGGQIVIPLMIQGLVTNQGLLSLSTFLSGYAIDQVIPGPLFSFASFVGAQAFADTPHAWWVGMLSSVAIFLPGILLVYLIMPIYTAIRTVPWMKTMLAGISIASASFIVLTGIQQLQGVGFDWINIGFVLATFSLLVWKKIPTPLVVLALVMLGFLI
jgi:chromate transporter